MTSQSLVLPITMPTRGRAAYSPTIRSCFWKVRILSQPHRFRLSGRGVADNLQALPLEDSLMKAKAKPEISPLMQTLSSYIAGALKKPLPKDVAEKTKHHL